MRRATEARLRRSFADVIGALLATAAGTLTVAGCSSGSGGELTNSQTGDGGVVTPTGYQTACAKDVKYTLLSGLKASPPVDGAVFRSESAFLIQNSEGYSGGVIGGGAPEDGDLWKGQASGESTGEICGKATNKAECLERANGYRVLPVTREACVAQYPSSYSSAACTTTYILYTRGDEIGVARNEAETKALIGTFDTIEEALWVTGNADLQRKCGNYPSGKVPDSSYRVASDGGFDIILYDAPNCGKQTFEVVAHVDPAGNLTEISRRDINVTPGCAVAGRRPAGLCSRDPAERGSGAVGRHFAAMASLEAASVVAFRRLARQLAAHGAPRELLDRIREATRDEIRHARATRMLANKYGVVPRPPQIDPCEEHPSLLAIALENAREGCVRETFGALVAQLQVVRAADPQVSAEMVAIADEETQHAALSWDLAEWIASQLTADERALVDEERRTALASLARELVAPVDGDVRAIAGMPTPAEALRMLDGIAPTLLAA